MCALLHDPVLLGPSGGPSPVLDMLQPKAGETVLDVTMGLAGHSKAFLERIGPTGLLIGLDADSENLEEARRRLEPWSTQTRLIHANFRDLPGLDLPPFDILFADLGLSSPHIDDATRGFTFREEAPLDLRFDRTAGKTAADIMRTAEEREIYVALRDFGELQQAKTIARIIASRRDDGMPLETTKDLMECVEKATGFRAKKLLPQVFQALRIWVNDELGALRILLDIGPALLKPNGRMGVISYHSLEDRMVKQTFRALSTPVLDEITGAEKEPAPYGLLTKKALTPDEDEVERNPRARSAKFRVLQRRNRK